MDPDHLKAGAFRDQLWSSLPALLPEINRLGNGDFDGSERERQLIQLLARVVTAELQFRADESRLESWLCQPLFIPAHQEHPMMRTVVAALALAVGLAALGMVAAPAADPPKQAPLLAPREGKSETIKLFDGKDLDGWEGREDLWSVQNGEIVGKNKDEVKVSTYLLTKQTFTDFRLTAKGKLAESEMHTGIALWGRKAPEKGDPFTYAGILVMFPSGWGMYDLYGRNGLPVDAAPAKKVGSKHDWNDLEILAQGNRVRVAVNGAQVVDWREPEPYRIKEGPIGLQLHSNKMPQEVRFKDLVVETFPKEERLTTVKEK